VLQPSDTYFAVGSDSEATDITGESGEGYATFLAT
jgi:hypothetical protein